MKDSGNNRRNKKIRKTIILLALIGIVLSVSTYAWFIGMKTVNVQQFEIDIATTEGLFLSMNGKDWSYNLDAKNAPAYADNANVWLDGTKLADNGKDQVPQGLIPMSSIGDMDETSSRMKLYEKGSFNGVPNGGGARLLTSQVKNNVNQKETSKEYIEGDGYVAFDLFIKNISGEAYYEENNPENEEAVYLTVNSSVKVSANGGVEGTGIENSVRVGIVQIGRVSADNNIGGSDDAKAAIVTSITCKDDETKKITGICRNAQIWEPNDKAHVQNAIKYYDTNCKARKTDSTDVNDSKQYEGACETIADNNAYPTYAISRAITPADNVNIYDGAKFNKFTASSTTYQNYIDATAEDRAAMKLVEFPYFTDTMKLISGVNRPVFMTLAPNSITKLRVYIWLEGQDIDNYDFASLGKKISVNFGFTKEQLTEEDFDYEGASSNQTPTPEEEGGVNNPPKNPVGD